MAKPLVEVAISADGSVFVREVDKAAASAKKLQESVDASAKTSEQSGKSFADLSNKLRDGAAVAAKFAAGAAAVGAAMLTGLVANGLKSVDALAKTADKLGLTTEALAGLQHAANMAGVSQTALEGGLKKLAVNLTAAATGSGTAAKAFQTLGLQADEIIKLPLDKQLGVVGDALKNVENESQRAALAQKIFGKAGVDLLNLTKEGSSALAAYAREAKTLGLNLSRVDAANVEAAGDAIEKITTGVEGLGRQLAAKFAPFIKLAADRVYGLIENFGGMETIAARVFDALVTGAGYVANAIVGIRVGWLEFRSAFQTVAAAVARGFDALASTIASAWNALPFVDDIDYEGTGIAGFLASMESGVAETRRQIDGILSEPLPSEQVEQYAADVAAAMTAQSEATVEAMAASSGAIISTEEVTGSLAATTDKAAEAAQRAQEQIDEQIQSLVQQQAALRMSELDQARFNAQLALGAEATDAQRLQVDALVVANFKAQEAAQAAADGTTAQTGAMQEATKVADPWAEALTGAVERVDSAFAELWKGAFDGFSDFADNLKEAFRTLLAELAHQAITRPIVMRIGAALGLGGGSAGAMAGTGGFGGIGSLFSGVSSFVGGFRSGGFSGGLNALFGGSATGGSLGNALSSARFALGDTASFFGLDGLANRFNAQGLQINSFGGNLMDLGMNVGAGFAGGYAGNAIGQSLFGERKTTGIGSTLGGTIGSAWGPIGTFLGSTLGAIAENAIGKIFGAGDLVKWGKLGVTTGAAPTDGSGLRTVQAASGLSLTAVAKRTDEQSANDLLDAFVALDEGLTTVARGLGVTVDFAGKILGNTSLNVDNEGAADAFGVGARLDEFSTDKIKTAAADFVRAWIVEISTDLPQRVRSYMDQYADLDATAEQMVQAFGFIAEIDKLLNLDVVAATSRDAEAATQGLLAVYDQATTEVLRLADAYDGSLGSLEALTNGLMTQKQVAAQLAAAYNELAGIVDSTFGGTAQMLRESLLSEEDLYALRRNQISEAVAALGSASDPEAIAALVSQIDELVKSAYGLAADENKAAVAEELIAILDGASTVAGERIDAELQRLREQEGSIVEAIDTELLATAATTQAAAADRQSAAADRQLEAANINFAAAGQISGVGVSLPVFLAALMTRLEALDANGRLENARPGPNG